MVSQPGVSDEATICLERMIGTIYGEEGVKIVGKNHPHAPFKHQTEAFRFSAMVGHRLDCRTEGGVMVTKWGTVSATGGHNFEALFAHTGRDLDHIDWVDAMNCCADWGAIYIDGYHRDGDQYTLRDLIEILTTDDEIHECNYCRAWRKTTDEKCWFCKS